MLDDRVRPLLDRLLAGPGRLLARLGVTANMVTCAGFGFGMAGAVAIGAGCFTAAVIFILINRLCDGLDGAVARATGPSDAGGFLDITLDFIFYSAVPFAFAVQDPATETRRGRLYVALCGKGPSGLW